MTLQQYLRTALCAAALGLGTATANAAGYTFSGSFDAGDLAGTAFSGSFAYQDPAAAYTGEVALDSFSLSFGGLSFTLDQADPASRPTAQIDAGQLSAVHYEGALAARQVGLYTGFPSPWLGTLDVQGAGVFSTGSFSVSAVPEPGTCAMLLAGLGVLGAAARRRQAGARRA